MSGKENLSGGPVVQQPKKKGPMVLAVIFAIGMAMFLAAVIWINWPKPEIQSEPLSPALRSVIQNLPGSSDAIFYVGMKDIRKSRFWNEIIPDSIKHKPLFHAGDRLEAVMEKTGIKPAEDLDTLLVSFQRSGKKQQKFIGLASGSFSSKLPKSTLEAESIEKADINGYRAYALDDNFWVCPVNSHSMVIASSSKMVAGYLAPAGRFLDRDSVSSALISKAAFKSHLWFTLASPLWTIGALQSLTSGNRDVKSVGNLNRIQQLVMSVRFGDGLKGHSEWIYKNRRSAFFASSFLWGTIKLASNPGTRTSEPSRALLNHLKVHQNLESVIVTTDLPLSSFKKVLSPE